MVKPIHIKEAAYLRSKGSFLVILGLCFDFSRTIKDRWKLTDKKFGPFINKEDLVFTLTDTITHRVPLTLGSFKFWKSPFISPFSTYVITYYLSRQIKDELGSNK